MVACQINALDGYKISGVNSNGLIRKPVAALGVFKNPCTPAVVVCDTGLVDPNSPAVSSNLRLEKFASRIEEVYLSRNKDLPPHER